MGRQAQFPRLGLQASRTMQGFMSDLQLRLMQRGIALACAFTFFLMGLGWSCGVSSMFTATLHILVQDWIRYLLILYAAHVILFVMTSDVLEYFLWKKGRRQTFQPVQRNLWSWEIGKKSEPIPMDVYEANIQSQVVIIIPLVSVLLVVFFRFFTRSFCVALS